MPIMPMPEIDIVKKLASRGYMIEPGALRLLEARADILDRLLDGMDPMAFIVTSGDIEPLLARPEARVAKAAAVIAAESKARDIVPPEARAPARAGITGKPGVRVISDITDNSTCVGDYDEFVGFFRYRYAALGEIDWGRVSARPVESVRKNSRRSTGERTRSRSSAWSATYGRRPAATGLPSWRTGPARSTCSSRRTATSRTRRCCMTR